MIGWEVCLHVSMKTWLRRQDVLLFACTSTQAQIIIWKSFLVENSTSFLYLPIPLSAETWKIFKHAVSIFFTQADILGEKNPYFGKPLFWKTITDYVLDFMYKTSGLVRISLLISSITKIFVFFIRKVNL